MSKTAWLTVVLLLAQTCAAPARHGTVSARTLDTGGAELCDHGVPERACTRHHPALSDAFKASGDWCAEHDRPESQCLICHPDLSFEPLPTLHPSANLSWLSRGGEAIGPLAAQAVPGKVTVFDFYADWCAPCRKVDRFLFEQLARRDDLAVRKVNVVSWDTPVAREHLAQVPSLPFLVVAGPDGRVRRTVVGFDLAQLEAAVREGEP